MTSRNIGTPPARPANLVLPSPAAAGLDPDLWDAIDLQIKKTAVAQVSAFRTKLQLNPALTRGPVGLCSRIFNAVVPASRRAAGTPPQVLTVVQFRQLLEALIPPAGFEKLYAETDHTPGLIYIGEAAQAMFECIKRCTRRPSVGR